jgi:4-hydroxybenzoate polyprenyltransferase
MPRRSAMGIIKRCWDLFIDPKRERFLPRAFLSLTIAISSAVLSFIFLVIAGLAAYGICGDVTAEFCGPKPWVVYVPGLAFLAVSAVCLLIGALSLIRAVILIALGVRNWMS